MSFKLKLNYKSAKLLFSYSCAFMGYRAKVYLKRNDPTSSFKRAAWKRLFPVFPTKKEKFSDQKKKKSIKNEYNSKLMRILKQNTSNSRPQCK